MLFITILVSNVPFLILSVVKSGRFSSFLQKEFKNVYLLACHKKHKEESKGNVKGAIFIMQRISVRFFLGGINYQKAMIPCITYNFMNKINVSLTLLRRSRAILIL